MIFKFGSERVREIGWHCGGTFASVCACVCVCVYVHVCIH